MAYVGNLSWCELTIGGRREIHISSPVRTRRQKPQERPQPASLLAALPWGFRSSCSESRNSSPSGWAGGPRSKPDLLKSQSQNLNLKKKNQSCSSDDTIYHMMGRKAASVGFAILRFCLSLNWFPEEWERNRRELWPKVRARLCEVCRHREPFALERIGVSGQLAPLHSPRRRCFIFIFILILILILKNLVGGFLGLCDRNCCRCCRCFGQSG